jgi:DNA polymerase epsilon subunit 2
MLGASSSKASYLRDRYSIIKQTILRSEHFSPPALPGHDRSEYLQVRNETPRHRS